MQKDALVKIITDSIMILFIPGILIVGLGMWLIDKCVLTDEDRYQLGKKR